MDRTQVPGHRVRYVIAVAINGVALMVVQVVRHFRRRPHRVSGRRRTRGPAQCGGQADHMDVDGNGISGETMHHDATEVRLFEF